MLNINLDIRPVFKLLQVNGKEIKVPKLGLKHHAILKDPLTGEIVDPFGGRMDIEKKIIRHVSDHSFPEDSLRVLRAAVFAARFEFDIASDTVELCRQMDVTDLPRERIWGELQKLLLLLKVERNVKVN